VLDVAPEGEDLGPLALLGAGARVPLGALEDDRGDVGEGLDVVEHTGLAPEARDGREGRPRARLTAMALDGGHQRGLLAADEGARAHADLEVEVEAAPEDVLAEQPVLARLVQGVLETLDGKRILGAHIHVPLVRADGVGADDHALDEGVRVAFEDGAVHERAGVAFVGVAQHVLDVAALLLGEPPLHASGKAGAAATAQAAGQHLLDDLFGGHLGDDLGEGLVPVAGDVLADVEGVDDPAVPQHDLDLAVEERDVRHLRLGLVGTGSVAHEALDDAALEQVLLDDLGDVLDVDVLVEDAVRVDQGHRATHAGAETAGLHDVDLAGQVSLLELGAYGLAHLERPGGDAAAARADQEMGSRCSHSHVTRSQASIR